VPAVAVALFGFVGLEESHFEGNKGPPIGRYTTAGAYSFRLGAVAATRP